MELDKYKLKKKERERIERILEKAGKRPRKKTYTPKWIYDYLDEGFKDFTYDNFDDALDMINTLFDIGNLIGISLNRLRGDIKYHFNEEGFNEWIDVENFLENKQTKRLRKLLKKWGLKEKAIFYLKKEELDA